MPFLFIHNGWINLKKMLENKCETCHKGTHLIDVIFSHEMGGEIIKSAFSIYFLNRMKIGAILQALRRRVLVVYNETLEEINEVGQSIIIPGGGLSASNNKNLYFYQ